MLVFTTVEPALLRTVVESVFQRLRYCSTTEEQQRVVKTFMHERNVLQDTCIV